MPTSRTAEPYRDPTPGIQARLAELRASWAARAAAALDERAAVLREQAGQVALARALSLGQALIAATAVTIWLYGLAQPDVEVVLVQKCGTSSLLSMPLLGVLIALPLWLLARYARWQGARTAVAYAARRVTSASGGGMNVELERLANERPDARLEAHLQWLRRQNRSWSQVACGLALVCLPLLIGAMGDDLSSMIDAAFLAVFPLGMLVIGLVLALEPRLVSTWWAVLPVTAALAILAVSSFAGAGALVLTVVQGSIVVQRLTVR